MLFFYDTPGFDEAFGTLILGSPFILGMLVLIYYIIGAVLAIWVYKNAKKRNMKYKLWLYGTLLSGFIGFLVYLTVRDPLPKKD